MTERNKQRIALLLPILICCVCIISVSAFWLREYRQVSFGQISKFCQTIIENNPEAETMILSSLKECHTYADKEIQNNVFLEQYGYRRDDFDNNVQPQMILITLIAISMIICGILFYIGYVKKHTQARIEELTNYLETVNIGTFGTILQKKEDDFSHLEDEIYKTVTTLRQTRDTAVTTKMNYAHNLANIAHQLKTQLTAISLSVQFIKQTSPVKHIGKIEKQLERLNWLEESLLTISQIDAGVLQLERSPVDIYTALTLASENLNDLLKEKNITVSIPDKGCVEIYGDLEWTMEAFINMIKNCMEHSFQGGTIYCDYSHNPLYVEVLIWDEGNGFEPEDIPHLFERFYRGKGAMSNGIGIGLSLARSIFEMQNGNITARNLPDGGACFEIRVYSH